LAGVPVLVKEIIKVEGMPYECGSASMRGKADRDADVVTRLRAAGAIIIGLSHSHEFAYGCTGTSNRFGPCRHPQNRGRMPGGSSSGAAVAVATGVVRLAIGTDTAGSIRIPAALCGVVGYKPARDTLSTDGVFPLAQSLDHVGVITNTVADAVYAVNALTGTSSVSVGEPTFGVVTNPEYTDYDKEVGEVWSRAISLFETREVELPDWNATQQAGVDLQGPEAVANHMGRSRAVYQPDVRLRLEEAAEVPAWRYVQARKTAVDLTAAVRELLDEVDAVLLPTVPIVAPLIDEAPTVRARLMRNTRLGNLTGFPAFSIPLPTAGLPVGLQLIARDNQTAGAAAAWLQARLTQL
jgi:aspartyl-tRNA(Asn)/glutamyl-tRNA(Gln) amidotransferase subunit A